MLPALRPFLLVLLSFTLSYGRGQVPLIDFPDLTSITFHEQTGGITPYTFNVNSIELTTRVPGQLNTTNRDFEGVPDREFYDVYYSDINGTFNINGGYVSIECQYGVNFGSALNINEVEFHFGSGYSTFARYKTSYLGSNYVPGSEEMASDCDMATFTEMGYTGNSSLKLRVTIGILNASSTIIQEVCSESGYEVMVGNTVYNEANPFGTDLLTGNDGCDSLVYVDLTFNEVYAQEINYSGCNGDGYSIVVGNTLYNESNPSGTEMLLSQGNCDSTIVVDLVFGPVYSNEIIYNGCEGDGYSVNVNGTVYNEANPVGTETMLTSNGCDSVYTIELAFAPTSFYEIDYIGCSGDNYSVEVNGTIYDEDNPQGEEYLINQYGCDSIIQIALTFLQTTSQMLTYSGCTGDGYSIMVNGTIYDEANPTGQEILTTANGCDSIVSVALSFLPVLMGNEFHTACMGSGFSLMVNGKLYDENMPSGVEMLISQTGCDSVVNIQLDFIAGDTGVETYSGCSGDGYSVTVNGTIYDELNPSGVEILLGQGGCDSIVTVDLFFQNYASSIHSYSGCLGDGYSVTINGTTYDEQNPNGVETLTTINGCDSIITITLSFENTGSTDITYTGCSGDGYEVIVNGSSYNESNPSGLEMVQTTSGCDSIIQIALTYEDCDEEALDCTIYIPNVISPNDDGINDEFSFGYSASCEVARFSVALFDRWGQALYASNEPLFKWKGEFKDKSLSPGVYVYVAEIYFADTSTPLIRRGDVTIIR